MEAWITDNGIRLNGVEAYQANNAQTFERLLDTLKARTLENGKRVSYETADVALVHHTIDTAEAVKSLEAAGIETYHSVTPLTPKLLQHLSKCERAVQAVKPILAPLYFPDDYRTSVVVGFISTLLEHHEAYLVLCHKEMFGSAFALGRPVVEAMYRALWLNACATDAELNRFIQKDEINLSMAELAQAIDATHTGGRLFQDLKKNAWKMLNSYTHTGMLQIGRRFTKQAVVNSYQESEVEEMTTAVTTCALIAVSRFLAKQNHPDAANRVDALHETYGPRAQP